MFERLTHSNEIISLTIMLLMAMALVASQADATIQDEVREAAAMEQARSQNETDMSFSATIEGHINGIPLTISIGTVAESGLFRLESQ